MKPPTSHLCQMIDQQLLAALVMLWANKMRKSLRIPF